ncbi:MAG TPA: ShlB/FhaC/HecB family hemolysin secretion/activation protein [Verrucomicrobiae bacterium]|jgi:hemolysin activation/secretion protein
MAAPNPLPNHRAFFFRCALAAVLAGLCLTCRAAETNQASTNAAPPAQTLHFRIDRYDVAGNTLLPEKVLHGILAKHTGDVTFVDVAKAVKELQMEYHDRGFDTISVTIPQQRLTNAVFKIQVFEGRLAEIIVKGNRFYSSNNVMRALPGLKPNIHMNSKLLQPQLDLANANQDRQIYPEIHPGPTPDTTSLVLQVKDRQPLHAKIEANNQSTPGTPDMRLASSAVYNNLWQLDHSFGIQYTFSEEDSKQGGKWNFYDQPQVANYSIFYRLPLGSPDSFADEAARVADKFGYNEATRKFVLPPGTGAPELNIYASGSTIDTGVQDGAAQNIPLGTNGGAGNSAFRQDVTQDLTENYDLGWRVTKPLPEFWGFSSRFRAGMDLKDFKTVFFETNVFHFLEYETNLNGQPFLLNNVFTSPEPATRLSLLYLPINVRWDATRNDHYGTTGFGLGYSPNVWHSGSRSNLDELAVSTHATGYWHILSGNVSREETLPRNWKLALRADGQWSSEPLISNEEFGAGGIAGVRGYREGEVFGDEGWRVTSELKLPPYRIGYATRGTHEPLTVRASFFMDYAETYLLDPQGFPAVTPLWGTGFAGAISLGSHFNGMLSFAWPLLSTPSSEAYHVRIAFALSAQF